MNTERTSVFQSLPRLLRRVWWATLPYWGWVGTTAEDVADGARPCPWWAHPLAWVNRLAAFLLRRRGVFGPRHAAWSYRPLVGSERPHPWQ